MSILLTASESASAGSMIPLILMYVVVFGVFFYFVLYRPQKKEQKKAQKPDGNGAAEMNMKNKRG